MTNLIILSKEIRQHDGLYSLNDLHKASGNADKHRPGYFIELQQTRELVAEIQNAGIPAIKTYRGCNGGTYANKEMVIAYAMWINAPFALKVIRVFLGQVDTPKQLPLTNPAAITLTEYEAHNLAGLFSLIAMFKPDIQRAEQMLRAVDSPHAPRMFDAWHETAFFAGSLTDLRRRCQVTYNRRHQITTR